MHVGFLAAARAIGVIQATRDAPHGLTYHVEESAAPSGSSAR